MVIPLDVLAPVMGIAAAFVCIAIIFELFLRELPEPESSPFLTDDNDLLRAEGDERPPPWEDITHINGRSIESEIGYQRQSASLTRLTRQNCTHPRTETKKLNGKLYESCRDCPHRKWVGP